MTDHMAARAWLDGYIRAWRSDDPDDIRALFTADARYRTDPFTTWEGRERIVEQWRAIGDATTNWRFDGDVIAVDGALVVIRGSTEYFDNPGQDDEHYANLWLVELGPDGRATSFEEWWMAPEGNGDPADPGT